MSDKNEMQYLKTGRSKSSNQQHRGFSPAYPTISSDHSFKKSNNEAQEGQSMANVTDVNPSDAGAWETSVTSAPPKHTEPLVPQRSSQSVPKAPVSQSAFWDEEQAKQRQLKAILNKRITPQNLSKFIERVQAVNIDNAITLRGVVSQIYDKALMETTFCQMYANLCFHLAAELPDFSEDNEKITFKRLLLNKCQEEFERGEREQVEANKADEEGEVKQSEEEREEKRIKARRRMLGNIRFIGGLYKKKMLTESIMHHCIKKLLGQQQDPDEEDIEALCKLMSTIGEMIDHPRAKERMDAYFERMKSLSNNMNLSSRVRLMLQDTIDLRKNRWQQRRKVKGPKKIKEVHRDAAKERQAHSSVLDQESMDFSPRASTMLTVLSHGMGNKEVASSKPSRSDQLSSRSQCTEFSGTTSNHEGESVGNTGGGGANIENIGSGGDSLTVSDSKDKPLPELSRTKSTTSKRKKERKEIISKAAAAMVKSDLYGAYKNPEGKKDIASSESVESTCTSIMSMQEAADSTQQVAIVRDEGTPSKAEPGDWEDLVDISTPKLGTSDSGEQACGDKDGRGHGAKKYSRDFLLKFSMQLLDLPEGFEIMSDIATFLNVNVNASPSIDYKPFPELSRTKSTSTSVMSKQEAADSTQQVAIVRDEGTPSKAEPDDWEDLVDISTPKLGTSDSGEQACGDKDGSGHGAKKYSRDFLLKFSMQLLDLPEGFEIMSDIATFLNVNVNASPSIDYKPLPELSRTKSTASKGKKKRKEILFKSAAAMVKSDQSSASELNVNFGSRDPRSTDRTPPPARALGAALTKNVPSETSEKHLRDLSSGAIKEFYSARDEKEVALCIKDLNSPSFHPSMISLWVTDSFERKDAERDLLAKLLVNLTKSQDGTLSQSQLIKGFEIVLSILEDAVIDAPRAPEFLGLIFAKVILENVVSLNQIGKLIHEGGEEPGHLLEVGLAGNVLGNILEIIKSEKGESVLHEICMSSNLRLETFRPPDPLKSRILEKFI
ncbi:hypothetical protein M0R45_035084 [Rubus argutus]|uniref:Eukaryotic translation initiation factor 4G n=1 Tax=Rubus argutus TaxID=59490 RepID=A0AAW1VSW8_RUBAR